ncbi:hypothetical protein [Peribacillus frigoritolerans]|nr:hypothetical protein [Peribacillus frigoritolerans]MCY8938063.1 hypothetical protein [Peribacillus frigoritolerans]
MEEAIIDFVIAVILIIGFTYGLISNLDIVSVSGREIIRSMYITRGH